MSHAKRHIVLLASLALGACSPPPDATVRTVDEVSTVDPQLLGGAWDCEKNVATAAPARTQPSPKIRLVYGKDGKVIGETIGGPVGASGPAAANWTIQGNQIVHNVATPGTGDYVFKGPKGTTIRTDVLKLTPNELVIRNEGDDQVTKCTRV